MNSFDESLTLRKSAMFEYAGRNTVNVFLTLGAEGDGVLFRSCNHGAVLFDLPPLTDSGAKKKKMCSGGTVASHRNHNYTKCPKE